MKKIFLLLSIAFFLNKVFSQQIIGNLNFGTDSTFEICTWNIENFPKNSTTTLNYLKTLFDSLKIDFYALQEIKSVTDFNQLMVMSNYQGATAPGSFKDLAFLYNPNIIKNVTYQEILTTYSSFTSKPLLIKFQYQNQNFNIINVHLKAFGDGILDLNNPNDEETRRYYSCVYIKNYIDTYLPDEKVIVLGDMNDILTDPQENNVFTPFLSDPNNYTFADMSIATSSSYYWSYPSPYNSSYKSHIDHILVTNELFEYLNKTSTIVKTLRISDYLLGGWNTYDANISDHYPVAMKIKFSNNTEPPDTIKNDSLKFAIYPNPTVDFINIIFDIIDQKANIEIINSAGKIVYSEQIPRWTQYKKIDLRPFKGGVYIVKISYETKTITKKIILYKN